MEKKIHVYIAGPFRAKTPWLIEQNVRRAEDAALEVWKMGAVAVVPHMLTRHFQEMLPDSVWLEGLLSLMSTCDVMLVLPGWRNSEGTKAEIVEAQKQTKHIFYTLKELSDWIVESKSVVSPIFRRIDEVCPECGCAYGFHKNDCEKI